MGFLKALNFPQICICMVSSDDEIWHTYNSPFPAAARKNGMPRLDSIPSFLLHYISARDRSFNTREDVQAKFASGMPHCLQGNWRLPTSMEGFVLRAGTVGTLVCPIHLVVMPDVTLNSSSSSSRCSLPPPLPAIASKQWRSLGQWYVAAEEVF